MYQLRVNQLAGCDYVQTLRRLASKCFPAQTTRNDMVCGLLRIHGSFVFVLLRFRNHLSDFRTDGTRYVRGRSKSDGHGFRCDGPGAGSSLRRRPIPPAKIMGVGVWIGVDLPRSNERLLSTCNNTVADPLD
jgi:hypothetical protein